MTVVLIGGVIRSQTLPGHTEPYDFFFAACSWRWRGTLGILSHTRRSYRQAVEARAEQAEAERERQIALAAAEERTRIARELHDVVAHHVSLMAVQSEAAAAAAARPGRGRKGRGDHRPDSQGGPDRARRLLAAARPGRCQRPGGRPHPPRRSVLDEAIGQVRQAGIAVNLRVEGSRQAVAGRGPDREPDRAGGADQHGRAFQRGRGRGDRQLWTRLRHRVRDRHGNGGRRRDLGHQARRGRAAVRRGRARPVVSGGFGLAGIAERVASCGS